LGVAALASFWPPPPMGRKSGVAITISVHRLWLKNLGILGQAPTQNQRICVFQGYAVGIEIIQPRGVADKQHWICNGKGLLPTVSVGGKQPLRVRNR